MPKRQDDSLLDDLFDLLKQAPAWVGPLLAVAVFWLFRYLFPALLPDKHNGFDIGIILRPTLPMVSWFAAGAVLVVWIIAEVSKLSNRRLLDRQDSIGSIRQLTWRELELLVAEAYRRRGYVAQVTGAASGDGGVDIRLTRPGETLLVQCKQWKAYTVGAPTVRELLGVVAAEKATGGIVVTSGRFTNAARRFAAGSDRIQLVDGPQLAELIRECQGPSQPHPGQQRPTFSASSSRASSPPVPSPRCPSCGSEMILRTARKGPHAGSRFWGCPKYPACRGTRPHPAAARIEP